MRITRKIIKYTNVSYDRSFTVPMIKYGIIVLVKGILQPVTG